MAGHPAEGSLDDRAARENHESGFRAFNNLDHEIEKRGFVEQLTPVMGTVGEQVLDLGPAPVGSFEEGLSARAVSDIGCRQIDHLQTTIGIDGNVALAADDLLGSAITARLGQQAP